MTPSQDPGSERPFNQGAVSTVAKYLCCSRGSCPPGPQLQGLESCAAQADPGPRIFLNSAVELEDESNLQDLLGVRLTGLQITLGLIQQ